MQSLPDDTLSTVSPVHPEHAGDFLRLQSLWTRSTRFGLLMAAVDNPDYAVSLRHLLDAQRQGNLLNVGIEDSPLDVLTALQAHTPAQAGAAHLVFVLDTPRSDSWWQHANVLRERWAEAWPGPLLLWLSSTDLDLVAHQAPDLWNWRDGVFDFTHFSLPTNHLPHPVNEAGRLFASGGTADSLSHRLQELEVLRANLADEDISANHMDLERAQLLLVLGRWSEAKVLAQHAQRCYLKQDRPSDAGHAMLLLADLMHRQGEVDRALQMLRNDVMPLFVNLGDEHSVALAQDQVADILRMQGSFEAALELYIQRVLPAFLKLGDLRSAAITQIKISDILQTLGQLDEALRLREVEALPLFRQLGDVRSIALTQGRIADIYYAQGKLDEALGVRLREELPILQRLGDKREVAIIMGKVAHIFEDKGQYDIAIKIHEEEELPVLKALGDVRELLVAKTNLALSLRMRGRPEDSEMAANLLTEAHASAQELGLPEAVTIDNYYQRIFGRSLAPVDPLR